VSSALTTARRERELTELAGGLVVDVLVIGGGVTGAGVALDAASRGLSVALVERRDLANGTSRWSSKLVHGGLRYLARGDVSLARQSAKERGALMEHTAPHLVRALPMLLALTPAVSTTQSAAVRSAHRAADGLRAMAGTSRKTLPPPRRVTAAEALRLVPALRPAGLRGGLIHWDGQLEDDVRLVIALARTAAAYGARILTYAAVTDVGGDGATIRDERTGQSFALRARHVINATGVWAAALEPNVQVRLSKGSHLIFRAASLGHPPGALTVQVPDDPNRYVFALPQPDDLIYLGLTDDDYVGQPSDEPVVSSAEEQFLLDVVNTALARPLTAADVVGSFAGFRPLLTGTGRTADLSRHHMVHVGSDGLVTVTGGKLTTYRAMAQDAVDRCTDEPCRTERLPLVGSDPALAGCEFPAGLPARLVRRYGNEAGAVAAFAGGDPAQLRPVAEGVPVLGVEFLWGVHHEMALTVEDLLDRRTRLGLVPADAERARPFAETALATL